MLSQTIHYDVAVVDRNAFGAIDRRVMVAHDVVQAMHQLGKRLCSEPAMSRTDSVTTTSSPIESACEEAGFVRASLPAAAWASLVLGTTLST